MVRFMIEEVLSFRCQVLSRAGRAGSLPRPLTSNFTLYTSNSADGRLYKQTQFPGLAVFGWPAPPGAPAARTNKPNFPDCGFRIPDSRQTCGTPPAACRTEGRLYKQTQLVGAKRAKQTQSAPAEKNRWGKRDPKRDLPRLGARPTLQGVQLHQTNPISWRSRAGRGLRNGARTSCTNKANSWRCRAGTSNPCAGAQGRLYEEPIVPNKANSPERIAPNKPNSDRGHVRLKSCMGKELW